MMLKAVILAGVGATVATFLLIYILNLFETIKWGGLANKVQMDFIRDYVLPEAVWLPSLQGLQFKKDGVAMVIAPHDRLSFISRFIIASRSEDMSPDRPFIRQRIVKNSELDHLIRVKIWGLENEFRLNIEEALDMPVDVKFDAQDIPDMLADKAKKEIDNEKEKEESN